MSFVQYECSPTGVGIITLDDPERLNAMGEEMAEHFSGLVARLKQESERPRAIILTGAGRAFSAGGNLQMLEDKTSLDPEENRTRMLNFYWSFLGMMDLGIPLIAAVNGHAIGAGLCVACACDIRVVASKAKLGFTFTRLGLHPGMGATFFLPRLIGSSASVELMCTGRVILGEEAPPLGLASRAVDSEQVVVEAKAVAEEILQCGPDSVRQLLETLRPGRDDVQSALEREAQCQAENYAGSEFAEGVRAAIEKRPASFQV